MFKAEVYARLVAGILARVQEQLTARANELLAAMRASPQDPFHFQIDIKVHIERPAGGKIRVKAPIAYTVKNSFGDDDLEIGPDMVDLMNGAAQETVTEFNKLMQAEGVKAKVEVTPAAGSKRGRKDGDA